MSAETDLRALLPRLDLLLAREITRLRARYQLSLDEFRGLYISDAQVDALLSDLGAPAEWSKPQARVSGGPLWDRVGREFSLCELEQDILLLALAPEVDVKYATLYAYLSDDIGRRWPTIDLALRLFAADPDTRQAVRGLLAPDANLFRRHLLRWTDREPRKSPLDAHGFMAATILVRHLLGLDLAEEFASGSTAAAVAPPTYRPLADLLPMLAHDQGRPLVLMEGRDGAGRCRAAMDSSQQLGRRLLCVDPTALLIEGAGLEARLEDAILAAHLQVSALFVRLDDIAPTPGIVARLAGCNVPLFIAVLIDSGWRRALRATPTIAVSFNPPPCADRQLMWRAALAAEGVRAANPTIARAAQRFRLNSGQIRRAARSVRLELRRVPGAGGGARVDDLLAAARTQCELDLGPLASRLTSRADWSDLVLPDGTRQQLQDLASAVVTRDRVFEEWGFGTVGRGSGPGIVALFAGVSGTGKTMSASVIARATGLDLWRIDLSTVVSKYIGETEKNLERVFTGAKAGDAILFFDEADALFGKRSDVKDAHDRYANIETAYLLQRLEDHDGVVILASNLSRNIDQAFLRRLHYVVDFPMPDASLRERLWRKAFPPAAPMHPEVDFAFLGRQFNFAGGDIRAAALDAAFLAAGNGGAVTMPIVVRAVARQMLKQGKVPATADFQPYQALLAQVASPSAHPRGHA